jgi:hypothetical protein
VLDAQITWRPQRAALDLVIDLPGLFSEVWGR